MNKEKITKNKDQITKNNEQRSMNKEESFVRRFILMQQGKLSNYALSLFFVLCTLFFCMCSNPFWTLLEGDGQLTGTITISPAQPKAGDTITIIYRPGTGEPAFPAGYTIEIYKDSPPPAELVSTTLPFTAADPGTYRIKITDPVTGNIKEESFTVTGLDELTGTVFTSPAPPEAGTPVTVTYVPATGEPPFPGDYQIEWFKESPPPAGSFISESTANPFTPTDPGIYKVRITDPATGKNNRANRNSKRSASAQPFRQCRHHRHRQNRRSADSRIRRRRRYGNLPMV